MLRSFFLSVAMSFLFVMTPVSAAWRTSGPMGGPVEVLAAAPSDPRVLYVASGATLFRSDDLGLTWTGSSVPSSTIATLAIDPHDSRVVYVMTALGNLYKTEDGGPTWNAVATNLRLWEWTSSIVIDPRDPNVLYVARNCGPYLQPFFEGAGVFKSVDGGLTFSPAMNGMVGFRRCASALSLDPLDPDTLYATPQYADHGYARSDDRAENWATVPLVPIESVVDPQDPQKRYGTTVGFFVASSDGGLTWADQTITVLERATQLPYGSVMATTIDDRGGRLFLAGSNGVYRSGDGGRTAIALEGIARERTSAIVYDDATGILIIATESGIYRSEAFPWDDWSPLPTGHHSLKMLDVAPSRTDPSTMYAISSRKVYVTRDQGSSWSVLGEPLPASGAEPDLRKITVDTAETIYVAGPNRRLYKLEADAQAWIEITTPWPFTGILADPVTANIVYLTNPLTPAIMRTPDGGATWTFHFTPTTDASSLAIDPRDGAVFYAGTRSALLKSRDGGHTWTDLLTGNITDVQISPRDPETVAAVEWDSGTKLGRFHVTHDAGRTWTSGPAPGEIISMTLDPRDAHTVVISTVADEIFRTRDDGLHWDRLTGNAPLVRAQLAFSRDGDRLHAATYGHGIWELVEQTKRRSVTPQ